MSKSPFKPLQTIITFHRIHHKVPGKYYQIRGNNHLTPVGKEHRILIPRMVHLHQNPANIFVLKMWLRINKRCVFFTYTIGKFRF